VLVNANTAQAGEWRPILREAPEIAEDIADAVTLIARISQLIREKECACARMDDKSDAGQRCQEELEALRVELSAVYNHLDTLLTELNEALRWQLDLTLEQLLAAYNAGCGSDECAGADLTCTVEPGPIEPVEVPGGECCEACPAPATHVCLACAQKHRFMRVGAICTAPDGTTYSSGMHTYDAGPNTPTIDIPFHYVELNVPSTWEVDLIPGDGFPSAGTTWSADNSGVEMVSCRYHEYFPEDPEIFEPLFFKNREWFFYFEDLPPMCKGAFAYLTRDPISSFDSTECSGNANGSWTQVDWPPGYTGPTDWTVRVKYEAVDPEEDAPQCILPEPRPERPDYTPSPRPSIEPLSPMPALENL
jgi:hypothetical protein